MLYGRLASPCLCLLAACLLTACGGAKVLKERDQQAVEFKAPLVLAEQGDIHLALDWVLVRNSPGSWVSNADWDEYRLNLTNHSGMPVKVFGAVLFDSLNTPLVPLAKRKHLVRASKKSVKRYKDQDLVVRAGWSEGTLLAAGTASAVGGYGLGMAALTSGSATTAGVALGALALAPVMAVGGIMRSVNNGRVSREIDARHTELPLSIDPQQMHRLDLFFPLAPSPLRLELELELADGTRQTMLIDTSEVLQGLHLVSIGPDTLLTRTNGRSRSGRSSRCFTLSYAGRYRRHPVRFPAAADCSTSSRTRADNCLCRDQGAASASATGTGSVRWRECRTHCTMWAASSAGTRDG